MKKLYIYYSLTGNGDIVGDYLKEKSVDVRKVEVYDELPKNTFFRILVGGYLAFINHKSKLKNFDNNIDLYDEVIIGSPIWNGRLSCPINAVLDNINLDNKKVTFIFYSGSGKADNLCKNISNIYKNVNIINIREPKKNNNELDKLKDL